MFILDILHPADVVLLADAAPAGGLVHPADVVPFADAAAATGGQSARNCPNGWVDGTYVGMGDRYFSTENSSFKSKR